MQRVGQLTQLVRELSRQGREHPWAEFKHNNTNADTIGKLVSAISNIAAVLGRPTGTVVWGIEDNTGRIVGTNFEPQAERTGNQHLVAWLDQTTSASVRTEFTEVFLEEQRLVVLEIDAASGSPTQFKGVEYIRRDTETKLLSECPQLGGQLWASFDTTPFEQRLTREAESANDVLRLLDIDAYRRLLLRPQTSDDDTLNYLESDGLIGRGGAVDSRALWDCEYRSAVIRMAPLCHFPVGSGWAERDVCRLSPGAAR